MFFKAFHHLFILIDLHVFFNFCSVETGTYRTNIILTFCKHLFPFVLFFVVVFFFATSLSLSLSLSYLQFKDEKTARTQFVTGSRTCHTRAQV